MFFRLLALVLTLWLTAHQTSAQSPSAPLKQAGQHQAKPPTVIETDLEANFDFRCTLKPTEATRTGGQAKSNSATGAASLLLGYQSGAAPLVLTFSDDAVRLVHHLNGKTSLLDTVRQPYAPPMKRAIPLVLQWRNGSLSLIYDGRTILRREGLKALPAQGVLATSGGRYEFAEALCQPVEPVAFADDFMRAAGDAGQWEPVAGDWKIHSAADPSKVANAFTYVAQGQPAIAVAGRWFWDNYRVGAAVRPAGRSAVGLIVFWQDAGNYLLFRWSSEEDEAMRGREKQLWRVWRGQPVLLATAAGGYRAGQWYQLSVSAIDGIITAGVDGQTALQKRTDLFGQGKAGLYCSGDQPLMVDDVTVDHASKGQVWQAVHREAITPQFTKEESMENWASPKAEWLPGAASGDAARAGESLLWNRGTFFGDHALEVKATAFEPNRARVVAVLCGDGKAADSGYSLVVTQAADKERLEATLLRRGKAISRPRSLKLEAPTGCTLRLTRVGRSVRGYVGKELVASYEDAAPLAGRQAAYSVQGAQVAVGEARVSGGNLYDYTFYRAPTDWYVSGGTWDMTSRWDCTPTWSWYGGWSDRIAAIWNKHSFSGDFVMDVFAACKRDVGGYKHPRDINITIAGDGRDLGSGYSLIFGGWNNTATRLLRGTQVVAETTKILLPKDYQGQAHHKWFNLRVERTGNLISLYVDRELALQYKDPRPLPAHRVALWTCGNGVMIARATLYYENELALEPVPPLLARDDGRTLITEKLGWTARGNDASLRLDAVAIESAPPSPRSATLISTRRLPTKLFPAVRAINLEGGGPFAIVPQIEPFDALKTPHLSFDCRLDKDADINLYLRVKGTIHSIRLTGPTQEMEGEGVKVLWAVKDVRADGQWHHVSLDLAGLLKPLYPNDGEIRVEELFLGNLTRDAYRQAGFGANAPGTGYLVRSFALGSLNGRVAKLIEPQIKSSVATLEAGAAPSSAAPLLIKVATKIEPKPAPAAAPVVTPVAAPVAAVRGLSNLRVTFCQDADAGDFKPEKLNQPIAWRCFSRPLFSAKADAIDFNWADKPPHAGIGVKYWSARFVGKLIVPQQGDYLFWVERLDDGARLYIDGKLVIDSWKIQAAISQASQAIALSPGAHDIRLDYSQGTGLGSLTLRWSGPGFEKESISQAPKTRTATHTAMVLGAR